MSILETPFEDKAREEVIHFKQLLHYTVGLVWKSP